MIPSYLDIQKSNDKELEKLCHKIRQTLLKTISKTGGHLSSNLGTVELTIALLKSFHPLEDDILFDVGHQCYSYKLLTGRNDFSSLRQENGISGYPDPKESKFDKFISGHSSTALSVALGFTIAKQQEGNKSHTVAIIGDGALTGGEAYEAFNNIGHLKLPIIVVLNDNEMSISKNIGSISKLLAKVRSSIFYRSISWKYKKIWLKLGIVGKIILSLTEKTKDMVKELLFPKMFFEEIGFTYLGPINGHEINEMTMILSRAKKIEKPVIIHIVTKKGKGVPFVEKNPVTFHSSPKYTIKNDELIVQESEITYSHIFGKTLLDVAEKDNRIIGLTAAMAEGLQMKAFCEKFPNRFFDLGITEQNMITVAGALAQKGFKPIVGIYSTFLQRGYDQIIHDCTILSEPVIFAVDRAGAVSDEGPTHQGSFDIAFLNPIPNTIILAPSSANELEKMLKWSVQSATKTTFVRYPKTTASTHINSQEIELGKGVLLSHGKDGYLVILGPFLELAKETIALLGSNNLAFGLIDARFAKPFDLDLLLDSFQKTHFMATIEDGVLEGGFGEQILHTFNQLDLLKKGTLLSFGLRSEYLKQMKREAILKRNGLHPQAISDTILERKRKS